eukprot:10859956-Ditylum_brightwellii.AAC.1
MLLCCNYSFDCQNNRGAGTTYTSTAYATLRGHLLSGEERVTVVLRDKKSNSDNDVLEDDDGSGGGYVD